MAESMPHVGAKNPVSMLHEQRQKGALLDLKYSDPGPLNNPPFTVTCSAVHAASGKKVYAAAAEASKVKAKNQAAQQVLEKLEQLMDE